MGISRFPLGSLETKWHLGVSPVANHIVYYKGKVVVSPKYEPWWVLWIRVCLWFVHAPKCSNYTLTNFLFGLCKSVWVIEMLVNLPSSIPELQHAALPSKCYEPRSAPQFLLLSLFTFGFVVESIKELRGASDYKYKGLVEPFTSLLMCWWQNL
jgi:hypothetical protein